MVDVLVLVVPRLIDRCSMQPASLSTEPSAIPLQMHAVPDSARTRRTRRSAEPRWTNSVTRPNTAPETLEVVLPIGLPMTGPDAVTAWPARVDSARRTIVRTVCPILTRPCSLPTEPHFPGRSAMSNRRRIPEFNAGLQSTRRQELCRLVPGSELFQPMSHPSIASHRWIALRLRR